jgi:hypothetical protein
MMVVDAWGVISLISPLDTAPGFERRFATITHRFRNQSVNSKSNIEQPYCLRQFFTQSVHR